MSLTAAGLVAAVALSACGTGATSSTPIDEVPTERSGEPAPAALPPDIDLSRSSVDPSEILFDTFDGGSVPLPDSSPQLRARLLDRIPPIDQPIYTDAAGGSVWLADDDLVVGYEAGGVAYAYPTKILNYHEIVNTVIDGREILVSYCPLCRSGIVYDRELDDGRTLTFSNTSALIEADMVMVDRETGSYWWQVLGAGIVGPLTGVGLRPLPSEMATWQSWLERHPDTVVLSRDTGFERPYERDRFSSFADRVATGDVPFHPGDIELTGRLGPEERVVIVDLGPLGGEGHVAYPFERFADARTDTIGALTLRISPHAGGADVATDAGETVATRNSFWFAAVGAFPQIQVRLAE
ncbi:MAG: DUF3179 domain-containing (seleno)protein [Actinomycetota bacterium]